MDKAIWTVWAPDRGGCNVTAACLVLIQPIWCNKDLYADTEVLLAAHEAPACWCNTVMDVCRCGDTFRCLPLIATSRYKRLNLPVCALPCSCLIPTQCAVIEIAPPPDVPVCVEKPGHHHVPERCVHTHFVQPHNAYMGMWIATHATLLRFIAHPLYSEPGAQTEEWAHLGWGYPERSTGMIQLINPVQNKQPAVLLPYFPGIEERPALATVGAVGHSRNGYSSDPATPAGKTRVGDALYYET